jgi:acetyl-CoA carboxylase biotin carboxyl carrier protein
LTLTAKDVAEILRLLEASNFDSFRLEMNGVKIELRRGSAVPDLSPVSAASSPAAAPAEPARSTKNAKPPSEPGVAEIRSPFVGIFYRAPRPNEPPFVHVGSQVKEDTMVGIIEVMKMMNPIRAGVKGDVVEILCENAAAVEYGETLMRVRPAARA